MDGWIDGWILWARGLRVTNTTFTQQRISPKTRRSSTSTGTEARHWYDNERPSQSPFSCYLSLSPPMSLYQHPPPPPAATLTRFMRRPRGAQKPKGTYRHCIAGHITYRYFFHPRISSLAELTLFPSGPSIPHHLTCALDFGAAASFASCTSTALWGRSTVSCSIIRGCYDKLV